MLFYYLFNKKFKSFSLIIFIFIFLSCKTDQQKKTQNNTSNPNVLFIAIDDLNDWVAPLNGHPQVKTPNIDKLASRGVLFTNAHAQSPICNPSRTSVLTGLRPSTTGIYGLSPTIRDVEDLKHIITLPQNFKRNGYTNYTTGKIYHGNMGRKKGNTEFDSIGPSISIGKKPESKITGYTPGGNHKLMDWGNFPHKDEEKGDYKVASWAVDVLNKKPTDPFFLAVGFFLPHVPVYVTDKWFDMYPYETLQMPPILENDRDDTPKFSWYNHWKVPEPRLKWMQENNQLKPFVRSYLGAVSFIDHQVGRLLDALDENGLSENTIVVLWSDHGYHLGEKQITGKNTLWERSTRVPLIFSGPGIPSNTTNSDPVELLDIFPTLNELCNLPTVENLEGESLVPQFMDNPKKRIKPAITTNNYNNHGIRSKNWRYIRYADGSEELYDLRNDPNEWHNLADNPDYEKRKEELSKWLPKENQLPHIGNNLRVLQYKDGQAIWEGELILPKDSIPGI